MAKVVVGMFDNMQYAHDAVNDLVNSGIDRSQISLIAGDERGELRKYVGTTETTSDAGTQIGESAAGGAGVGAVLGGIGGLLAGLGALAIPGFGPIIAAGPIVAALTGAGVGAAAGAVTGGLLGALVEMGIPEERATIYQDGIRHGNILVTARVDDDRAGSAVDILNRHHPVDVDRKSGEWRQTAPTMGSTTGTSDYTGTTQRDMSGMGTGSRRDYGVDTGSDVGMTGRSGDYTGSTTDYPGSTTTGSSFDRSGIGSDMGTGRNYQTYYDYGVHLHDDPRYSNRAWDNAFETDLRSYWETNYHDTPWEEFKAAVRRGWDSLTGKNNY